MVTKLFKNNEISKNAILLSLEPQSQTISTTYLPAILLYQLLIVLQI